MWNVKKITPISKSTLNQSSFLDQQLMNRINNNEKVSKEKLSAISGFL